MLLLFLLVGVWLLVVVVGGGCCWLDGWLVGRACGRVAWVGVGWVGWLDGWLAVWLIDPLFDCAIACWFAWLLVGRSVGWLVG